MRSLSDCAYNLMLQCRRLSAPKYTFHAGIEMDFINVQSSLLPRPRNRPGRWTAIDSRFALKVAFTGWECVYPEPRTHAGLLNVL